MSYFKTFQRRVLWLNRSGRSAFGRSAAALRALLLATMLIPVQDAMAQSTTIGFDNLGSGTVVNNVYPGVVFSNPLGGNVLASSTGNARSGSNVVSITPGSAAFNAMQGAVHATFATLQKTVSVDTAAIRSSADGYTAISRPFLEAYDANGLLVARTYFQGQLPGSGGLTPWETMTVTLPTAAIRSVRFSVQYNPQWPLVYGYFDNLSFSSQGGLYDDFGSTKWTSQTEGKGGVSIRQAFGKLEMVLDANAVGSSIVGRYESTCQIRGDFDIRATYALANFQPATGVRLALLAPGLGHIERTSFSSTDIAPAGESYLGAINQAYTPSAIPTGDKTGTLRIARTGSVLSTYFWNHAQARWEMLQSAPSSAADTRFQLQVWSHDAYFAHRQVVVLWDDVSVTQGHLVGAGC
jgi:hypothetical protein